MRRRVFWANETRRGSLRCFAGTNDPVLYQKRSEAQATSNVDERAVRVVLTWTPTRDDARTVRVPMTDRAMIDLAEAREHLASWRAALPSSAPCAGCAGVEAVDAFDGSAAAVNALPDRLRRYVHDLETRCDPAGDVRTIFAQRLELDALRAALSPPDGAREEG